MGGDNNYGSLNSERFLNAFAAIEEYLRDAARAGRGEGFRNLVDKVGRSRAEVRRFGEDLKEFAELRNAIVHERGGGYVIAEPNERVVEEIERIEVLLLKPPPVSSISHMPVLVLAADRPVADAVKIMLERNLSKIPVLKDRRFTGLLTGDTIARWLGSHAEEPTINLLEATVAEVLQYAEERDDHAYLSRESSVFEAIELFQRYQKRGKRLQAILITESGRSGEHIIGIMTLSDLPAAFAAVDVQAHRT
jgi:CBS domain-containing protein